MWRKALGFLLVLGSLAIAAVAVAILRDPEAGAWQVIGPWILALLFFVQGRKYLRDMQQPALALPVDSAFSVENEFDPGKRRRLVEKLKRMSGPKVIPVSEFFDGNYADQGAIAPNLWPEHPGIPAFASCFEKLLKREDVEAIYVEVSEVEPEEDCWPYSDRVYVFGDISDNDLKEHTSQLQPTQIGDRKDMFSPIQKSVRSLSSKPLHVLWWD